jgi:hypothetical protein
MDLLTTLKEQWPIFALIAWFGYKWWNSRRVVVCYPRQGKGCRIGDVRPQEFAAGQAPGTINIPLPELGHGCMKYAQCAGSAVLCQWNPKRHGQTAVAQEWVQRRVQRGRVDQVGLTRIPALDGGGCVAFAQGCIPKIRPVIFLATGARK